MPPLPCRFPAHSTGVCTLSYLSQTALVLVGITVLGHLDGSSYKDLVPTKGCAGLANMDLQVQVKPVQVKPLAFNA